MPEIITRSEAKARGLKRYFTGKPCKRGHLAERTADSSQCDQCRKLRQKTEKYRQNQRDWRNSNPDYGRLWATNNRGKVKASRKRSRLKSPNQTRERERIRSARRRAKWTDRQKEGKAASDRLYYEKNRSKIIENYYRGPQNPKGEKQWLNKAKAQLRNLKRLLRRPNRDHSSWLNMDQRP